MLTTLLLLILVDETVFIMSVTEFIFFSCIFLISVVLLLSNIIVDLACLKRLSFELSFPLLFFLSPTSLPLLTFFSRPVLGTSTFLKFSNFIFNFAIFFLGSATIFEFSAVLFFSNKSFCFSIAAFGFTFFIKSILLSFFVPIIIVLLLFKIAALLLALLRSCILSTANRFQPNSSAHSNSCFVRDRFNCLRQMIFQTFSVLHNYKIV